MGLHQSKRPSMIDLQHEIQHAFLWAKQLGAAAYRRRNVRSLLIITGVIVVSSGLLLSVVDPGIHSPISGIWYALVTLAHVGYGDIVASSPIGRFVSALLILLGIVLIALAAGIFASILVVQDLTHHQEDENPDLGHDHASAERKILSEIRRLHSRITDLEAALQQKTEVSRRK